MVYFQEKKSTELVSNKPVDTIPFHIIAVGDLLNLSINTPLQTSSQILNLKDVSSIQVKGDSTIEIPILGAINIVGLTIAQAKDTLLAHAKLYFNEPYVKIQLAAFKVTVLGEVSSPRNKINGV